jgi:hypothetical protein
MAEENLMRWNIARALALLVMQLTIAVSAAPSQAQRANMHSNTARGGVDVKQVAGRKVGNVTTRGNIITLELDADAVVPHNLFDLDRRTIRFTPAGAGYRAENLPLQWDTARRRGAAGTSQPGTAQQVQIPVLGPELGLAAGADHRIDHVRPWLQ